MRVFAGGIMTETNTFAPFPTGMADYQIVRAADYKPNKNGSDYGSAIQSMITVVNSLLRT